MSIIPFKIKPSSEKRSAENQSLLVAKIIEQVVKEVRMFIPAPIPGDKGEKGDIGERGEKGVKGDTGPRGEAGIAGINGRDGKDGIDGKDATLDTATVNELLLPHIETLRNEIKRIRQKGGGGGLTESQIIALILANQSSTIKDTFGITVDGGVVVLTTGTKGYRYIEQDCTITGWHLQADVSGDVVFDVKRSGVSIAGTEKPTLTAQQTNSDLALTTWTTSLVAGDIIEFVIDSASTITSATLTVLVTKI